METSPQRTSQQITKRPWLLLLLFIIFAFLFCSLVFVYPPDRLFGVGLLKIPLLLPGLFLLFMTVYSLSAFLFQKALQGIIIASTLLCYLLLSYFGLSQWLFGALLLGILGSIEFAIYKKK